ATGVERLAAFVPPARRGPPPMAAPEGLKLRGLDSLGGAIAALDSRLVRAVRPGVGQTGRRPPRTLIVGGRTSPARPASHTPAAHTAGGVRYRDFNDSFMAPGEPCHPSDNLGPVLAAVEFAGGDGRDLLVSLAVAYQVQCRLSEAAPVRARGFDHVTQGAYAV